ncbi:MAG: cell wall metabolism sensor histidine kinase WalK [Endomicrobia bacterium]|nr:cell wall metabolism sensor histidine kinase WalK [Endomicrobiia bacterium]
MKLRVKIGLTSIGLVFGVILAIAVILFIYERQVLLKNIEEANIKQVRALSEVAKESLIINDELVLLNYLKLIKKSSPEIEYANFISTRGVIIAHTDINQLGTLVNDTAWQKISVTDNLQKNSFVYNNKNIIDFSLPVIFNNEKYGYVRLGLLEEVINKNIQEELNKTRNRIFIVALFALVLGLVGSTVLAQTMTRPIKLLAEGAAKIGEGKLDTIIHVKSKDEIGALAKDFNEMAQKLKELDRMKEDFMSSVTHELRSPLTAIKGYIGLMLEGRAGQLSDKQKEFLTIVNNNTARLGRFINDILDLAKIEAGMMELRPEPVSVYEIARDVVMLMKEYKPTVNLVLDVPEKLPQITGDKDRIGQVLTNLVSNALKFTPDGGTVTVRGELKQDHILMSVKDTGIGMPKEALGKLFTKFQQVKSSKDKIKGPKGTGLGLAIAKGLVEGHGGKIWVESELNVGTTFYFTLPLQAKVKEGVRI